MSGIFSICHQFCGVESLALDMRLDPTSVGFHLLGPASFVRLLPQVYKVLPSFSGIRQEIQILVDSGGCKPDVVLHRLRPAFREFRRLVNG